MHIGFGKLIQEIAANIEKIYHSKKIHLCRFKVTQIGSDTINTSNALDYSNNCIVYLCLTESNAC